MEAGQVDEFVGQGDIQGRGARLLLQSGMSWHVLVRRYEQLSVEKQARGR